MHISFSRTHTAVYRHTCITGDPAHRRKTKPQNGGYRHIGHKRAMRREVHTHTHTNRSRGHTYTKPLARGQRSRAAPRHSIPHSHAERQRRVYRRRTRTDASRASSSPPYTCMRTLYVASQEAGTRHPRRHRRSTVHATSHRGERARARVGITTYGCACVPRRGGRRRAS